MTSRKVKFFEILSRISGLIIFPVGLKIRFFRPLFREFVSAVIIPVFIDQQEMYDALKDHQAIGACLENILLAAHALGLGGVWLGEILKNKEAVRKHLGLESRYELMAVLAIGHPRETGIKTGRKNLEELILKKFG